MKTVLFALLTVLLAVPSAVPAADDDPATVLVVRHRWHTGIALPAERLSPSLAFLRAYYAEPAWYEIGWGDDDFYRHTDNAWNLTKALFWPTGTVLHVVGLERHPAREPHTDIQAVCLPASALRRLQAAIAGDFRLGDDGRPVDDDPGLYGDSRFFPARGTFWFGHTCNTWTARRLALAGVAVGDRTLTADGVIDQLRVAGTGACPE